MQRIDGPGTEVAADKAGAPKEKSVPPLAATITPVIQRQSAAATGGLTAPPSVARRLQSRRGRGHALPAATRRQMEGVFGADFGGVRVHTDGEAGRISEQLGARAFTLGRDVYFGRGEFRLTSAAGRRLLGHELVHVVQQGGFFGGNTRMNAVASSIIMRTVEDYISRHRTAGVLRPERLGNSLRRHLIRNDYDARGVRWVLGVIRALNSDQQAEVSLFLIRGSDSNFRRSLAGSNHGLRLLGQLEEHLRDGIFRAAALWGGASDYSAWADRVRANIDSGRRSAAREAAAEAEEQQRATAPVEEQERRQRRTPARVVRERATAESSEETECREEPVTGFEEGYGECVEDPEAPFEEAYERTQPVTEFRPRRRVERPEGDERAAKSGAERAAIEGELSGEDLAFGCWLRRMSALEDCTAEDRPENPGRMMRQELIEAIADIRRSLEIGEETCGGQEPEYDTEFNMLLGTCRQRLERLEIALEENDRPIRELRARQEAWRRGIRESALLQTAFMSVMPQSVQGIFSEAFLIGFSTELPSQEIEDLPREIQEHPLAFYAGYLGGMPLGLWHGLTDMIDGIGDLLQLLWRYSTPRYIWQYITDRDEFWDERLREYRQYQAISQALQRFGAEFRRDPSVILETSVDLGLAVGSFAGRRFTRDFLRRDPRRQGGVIGDLVGRVLFEILLDVLLALATAGVGNYLRGVVGVGQGARATGRFANFLRPIVQNSRSIRRIFNIPDQLDEAAAAARLAEQTMGRSEATRIAGAAEDATALARRGGRTGDLPEVETPGRSSSSSRLSQPNVRDTPSTVVDETDIRRLSRHTDSFEGHNYRITESGSIWVCTSCNNITSDINFVINRPGSNLLNDPTAIGRIHYILSNGQNINLNRRVLRTIVEKTRERRKSIRRTLEHLTNLTRHSPPGADVVVGDLARGRNWHQGASWVLDYIERNTLWTRIDSLEVRAGGHRVYGRAREYDLVAAGHRFEFKDWNDFYPQTFAEQFARDLEITGPRNLRWIFSTDMGLSRQELRVAMLRALNREIRGSGSGRARLRLLRREFEAHFNEIVLINPRL